MDHRTPFIGDKSPNVKTVRYIPQQVGFLQANSYSVVGASVQGRLHCHNDVPRDDAFAASFNGTWLAAAVADGAGSRTNSRYGASYVAARLCGKLFQAVSSSQRSLVEQSEVTNRIKEIMSNAFENTRKDLEKFAFKRGVGLDELHCTLLGLALNVITGEIGVGQIGDGLILGLDNNKETKILADPPTTNDPGASYFITQADWKPYLDTQGMPNEETDHFSTFYLMTDGVANDCQYGPPPDILKRWANDMDREIRLVPSLQATAERLKSYLANYKAKGSFDDRTLIVIFKEKVK